MMIELMNVLYVTSLHAYVRLEHDTLRVEVARELKLRVPLLRLSGLVLIGNVMISPAAMARCAKEGMNVVFLDRTGRFVARVTGRVRGNVLLRREQHIVSMDDLRRRALCRQFVAGKIQNTRRLLQRAARDATNAEDESALRLASDKMVATLAALRTAYEDDEIRGYEGEAAKTYFAALTHAIKVDRHAFGLSGRSRRPPRDRTNALLSFLYSLLREECAAALEGVGLDAQVGFLHTLRPGRPSLALDLMEELRPLVADRLALRLINRRQLTADHFVDQPGGAVWLDDAGRRIVIGAYQESKLREMPHRVLDRKVPLGLVPHVQARLLARHLRGDMEHYLPFIADD